MTLVLIVDDSPIDRALAGGLLEKQGRCEIAYAENGEAGLKSVRDLKPDLIVTDMQMPIMNGLELVASLRNERIQIPVILMTATGSEELAVESLRVGASSYVSKRSLAKRLVDTARMVMASAKEDREQSVLMERLRSHSESFELDNRVEECMSLCRYLQATLSRIWNLNLTTRLRIGLALEEALLNALYHGNLEVSSELKELPDNSFYDLASRRQNELPYRDRRIDVTAQTTTVETQFVIRDNGPGFDVKTLPDPRDPQNISRSSGRGVMLMNTFMDEVHYNEQGNQVTLIKGTWEMRVTMQTEIWQNRNGVLHESLKRLLIVEDQTSLRQSLERGLTGEGYEVFTAKSGAEGYLLATNEQPDIVILDLLLPDGNGLETVEKLRRQGFDKPILILTARDAIEDRIAGLDAGADDYLVKPFAFGELIARLRALLRRNSHPAHTILTVGDLELNLLTRNVVRAGVEIDLTVRQFSVLEYLIRHQNQIVSRDMLARDVWKVPAASWTNVIEVKINQLRKKIERRDWKPLLHTIRKEGYMIGEST